MSTVSSTAPKPVETSAKPAQANERAQDRKPAGGDIFSSLLGLLASTQVLPEAATAQTAAPDQATRDKANGDEDPGNPLAALMGWGLPCAADTPAGQQVGTPGSAGNLGLPGAAWSSDRAATPGREGKIDITGMAAVESVPLEASVLEAPAPHAAARAGAPVATAARGTDPLAQGTPWRRAAPANTETQAIQQTAVQIAQTRSTVALNERFGLAPGVPLAGAERSAGSEGFKPTLAASGAAQPAGEATPALPGGPAGGGGTGSEHTGSDNSALDQADAFSDNTRAEANAGEEPTVTHWGTQHLRHASLRVGGEAGEQAIDIQLSMKGQEVQVEFKTDSAEARASLRENAGESLGELLNKSGMLLGGVSVGAQGQPGSRGRESAARQEGVRGLEPAGQKAVVQAPRAAPAALRADGSQPLDVFA